MHHRQFPNRFSIHRFNESRLDPLRYEGCFREHGQHTKLTGNTARRKPCRVGRFESSSHQSSLFGQLNPRSAGSIWYKWEPQLTFGPLAYSLQTSLPDGHLEQQQGLILSQDGTQRNLRSLPQKRLVGSVAPQVRSSLSRLVWSRFVECYEHGMAGKKKILIVEDNSDIRKLMVSTSLLSGSCRSSS